MSVTTAQMPVTAFCYGSAEQLDCLARLNIKTMEDMWRYIAESTPPVEDANVPLVIHKRHVIGLCTHRCNKLFFDFDKLYRERGVVVGGAWPNQWIALRTPRNAQKQRVIELPPDFTVTEEARHHKFYHTPRCHRKFLLVVVHSKPIKRVRVQL